jgi:hypothetical protein
VRKAAAKNILMKDGTARRLPYDQCETLLDSNQARRFISNTVYRAVKLGIAVKDHGTRDDDRKLRDAIKEARTKVTAAKHKAETKKKKREKERLEEEEAQIILNSD